MNAGRWRVATEPAERPFRFGVGMTGVTTRSGWIDKCRKAEDLGFDVVAVADHLHMLAPFPALVLAAEATKHLRVATAVLNAGFYHPALLAREVACTDQLTDGRLEVGLGAGYLRDDLERAGLQWQKPAERVTHLERTVSELRRLLADPSRTPRPTQRPHPPLWLAGRGNRMLRIAAREADIIGFSGVSFPVDGGNGVLDDPATMRERVEVTKSQLGDRLSEVELNIMVQRVVVTSDRRSAADRLTSRGRGVSLTPEQILEVPTVLVGTVEQIADNLVEMRERLGISYVTISEFNMESLAAVIDLLR